MISLQAPTNIFFGNHVTRLLVLTIGHVKRLDEGPGNMEDDVRFNIRALIRRFTSPIVEINNRGTAIQNNEGWCLVVAGSIAGSTATICHFVALHFIVTF
jgi:hypothetical protein